MSPFALHPNRNSLPVTDVNLDAPDGAIVDGWKRTGDRWNRLSHQEWLFENWWEQNQTDEVYKELARKIWDAAWDGGYRERCYEEKCAR
jgi:hypothetical protein